MKILLVDDHPVIRDGMALLIAHSFPGHQVLQAGSLAEAQACLRREGAITLVLLDLGLPDSKGVETIEALHELGTNARIVVMSANNDAQTILAAIDAGASGYVPKSAETTVMLSALRVVIDGGVYLPPPALMSTEPSEFDSTLQEAQDLEQLGLSPRQVDVLRSLIQGKPNKLICRDLGLSDSTVKTHLAAIFRKLGVNSRTQAVVAAARLGLRFEVSASAAR